MAPTLVLRRCLSTSSTVRLLVKSPLAVHGVEGRYASALYSAATKQKKLEAVESEMTKVHELYNKDKKFQQFVLDPTYKGTTKKSAIEGVLKKLGASETTVNFFSLVAENGRLNKLDSIARSFESIMRAHRGEIYCEVTTAKEFDATMMKQLNEALQAFISKGQKLHITTKTDPSILGGMIVNIGDRYVDMSIATKIKKYNDALKLAV